MNRGVKCIRISNIDCFVCWRIDGEAKVCIMKAYTKIRPGYVKLTVRIPDMEKFDINQQI